jgi:hypothetical protein
MSYRVIIQPNAEAELNVAYAYRRARAPQAQGIIRDSGKDSYARSISRKVRGVSIVVP